jgi:hypothetical protein
MIREGHDDTVNFFVGTEVEHTPAFGKKTLFVIGLQSPATIHAYAVAHECDHIYFGANMSFPNPGINDAEVWKQWESMIVTMLSSGRDHAHSYQCTLDIDSKSVEGLVEGPLTEYHNFIPMISVKLPYIKQLGYNATLKLDDRDFKATNPGVWCHSIHSLQDRHVFTDWDQYSKDTTIK